MLNTVYFGKKLQKNAPCVLLLGGFDGAHVGHRALVARAKESGLPLGIMTIFGGKGKEIFTLQERREIFRELGVDFSFELNFEEIRHLSPEAFSTALTSEFCVRAFYCGEDFRYGYMARGTPETLKRDTQVRVEVLELLKVGEKKVSASAVKQLLPNGEIEEANALLDAPFFLMGEVKKDRGVGRTIGFPTANISYPTEKIVLKQGVYQTSVKIDGREYAAITNYGARPTFQDETVCTETYLDAFSGNLYGRTLRVEFKRFLREIKKFSSVDELKEQLKKDIRRVREND